MTAQLYLGDCLEVMSGMEENSIDAIICDPPYGINFMSRLWDHGVPGVPFWEAALKVAKPGAHLLAFGGTRTHHRLMVAIEDAGWEIRDTLMWLYGSGMPKGHNISKAIDKAAGAEREVIGSGKGRTGNAVKNHLDIHGDDSYEWPGNFTVTAPATPEAAQWDGWNTNLKPAWEPIIMARKPLSEPTIAANVLKHGTGAINIDATRIGTEERISKGMSSLGVMHDDNWKPRDVTTVAQGRWPANLILSDDAAALLDKMSGTLHTHSPGKMRGEADDRPFDNSSFTGRGVRRHGSDSGGASRFFARFAPDADDEPLRMAYVPKASKRDRSSDGTMNNTHATVKPQMLMRWLARLVCPPGGTILDPFLGSGSTGVAAIMEGFNFVGIDIEAEYLAIAQARIDYALAQMGVAA